MIAVVQRVKEAYCSVDGKIVSRIGNGLLILIGVEKSDTIENVDRLAEKCVYLRCFSNNKGKMSLSLMDIGGECMVISQVTLLADTSKGRRPDFSRASLPGSASEFYHKFIDATKRYGISVKEGVFGAHMQIGLINDGPVTLILEG